MTGGCGKKNHQPKFSTGAYGIRAMRFEDSQQECERRLEAFGLFERVIDKNSEAGFALRIARALRAERPAALPAASTITFPRAGGGGSCCTRQFAGCAAATAASNIFVRSALVSFQSMWRFSRFVLFVWLGVAWFLDGKGNEMSKMDDRTRTELEAAVYRRLVQHLRNRTEVQNIDLMNLAGFCRNCLSNWMKDAADEKGVALTKDESREAVYGMPYEEWKKLYQREASAEQKEGFTKPQAKH